jgi:DNA-binding beta-propeller fold protein YncE
VFGLDGTFKRGWGSEGEGEGKFDCPGDVVVQGELLYVSDTDNCRVQVFEKKTGKFAYKWGSRGLGPGLFNEPYGLALTGNDKLWVCDSKNNRVQLFL